MILQLQRNKRATGVERKGNCILLHCRFVDEALAADFMSAFQNIMERPEFMDLGMMPIVRKDRAKSADAL